MADALIGRTVAIRDALINGSEEAGVIGYRPGLHVQCLPASVYWYGLRRRGILRFDGTEEDYGLYLDSFYKRLDGAVTTGQRHSGQQYDGARGLTFSSRSKAARC